MSMPLVIALILILAGLWNLGVWPNFLRRVLKDPRARNEEGRATKFLIVHIWLVAISMTLGAFVLVVGIRGLFS